MSTQFSNLTTQNATLPANPIIKIYACTIPGSTMAARLVAVVGRESSAIIGARAFAQVSGKIHFVEIAEPGKYMRRVWVKPGEKLTQSERLHESAFQSNIERLRKVADEKIYPGVKF